MRSIPDAGLPAAALVAGRALGARRAARLRERHGGRISLLDRPWLGHWESVHAAPVAARPVEEIRAALLELFDRHPQHVLISRLDVATRRWRPVERGAAEAYCERVVAVTDDPEPGTEDAFLMANLPALDAELPFRLLVGPRSTTIYVTHALGDGATVTRLFPALTGADADQLLAVEPRARLGTLAAGLVDGLIRSGTRYHRPRRPAPTQLRQPTWAPLSTTQPAPPRPDGPGLVSQVVGNGAFADLLRWRKEHAPGSGLSALLVSVLYLALVREGLCIDPSGYYGLVDIRRYLRERDRDGFGNLAKSLYVAVDPADPVAVGAAFADTVASGWALPGTLYGSLVSTIPHWGSAAHRARHTQPGTQAGGGDLPIRLSVSVMPNLPGVEDLPWLDTASRRYVGAGWTNGPAALNLFAIRLRSHLELCATFRTASVPADKVRAALSSVADPVALLSAHPVDGPVHSDG